MPDRREAICYDRPTVHTHRYLKCSVNLLWNGKDLHIINGSWRHAGAKLVAATQNFAILAMHFPQRLESVLCDPKFNRSLKHERHAGAPDGRQSTDLISSFAAYNLASETFAPVLLMIALSSAPLI